MKKLLIEGEPDNAVEGEVVEVEDEVGEEEGEAGEGGEASSSNDGRGMFKAEVASVVSSDVLLSENGISEEEEEEEEERGETIGMLPGETIGQLPGEKTGEIVHNEGVFPVRGFDPISDTPLLED